jgi:hypothetical protein
MNKNPSFKEAFQFWLKLGFISFEIYGHKKLSRQLSLMEHRFFMMIKIFYD